MQNKSDSRPRSSTLLLTLVVLIVSLLCAGLFDLWYQGQMRQEEHAQTSQTLTPYGQALNTALNQRLALLDALVAFAKTHADAPPLEALFDTFAAGLSSGKQGIRALQLYRNDRSLLVYPHKGNEVTLSRRLQDLINDARPNVRVDVQRAINSAKTALSGPYELRQGGLGLVARKAIFIEGELWGLAVVVLDVPPILKEAGVKESNGQLNLALTNHEGGIFFGAPATVRQPTATYPVALPDRPWLLAATPVADVQKSGMGPLFFFRLAAFCIILLSTILTYNITSGRSRLNSIVKKRTRALADSRNRYSSLIEKMSSGFALHEIICDEEGIPCDYRFIEVNKAFEEMTGMSRFKVLGKTVLELLPDTESSWIERFGTVALTGEPQHFVDYSAELEKDYEVTAYSPETGQFAAIFNDVSKRREAEDKIQKLNTELEDRVKQRTAECELSNRELEDFSYSISHDLRAPLRAINGYSCLLEEELPATASEKMRSQILAIQANSRRMGQLVDDLLTYTRLNKGLSRFSQVNLKAVMEKVWEEIMRSNVKQAVDFRLHALPPCHGDASLLKQLAFNLLDNAVKFTASREQPVIEVGSKNEDGQIIYFVKDNGAGFDMRYVDKLFVVFSRLHSEEDFEGTGIGLSLAKRIIERHEGRIWAEGKPGEGATFYFTIGYDAPVASLM